MGELCAMDIPADGRLEEFRRTVRSRGAELYRDLPWRRTRDPYAIWISEVMLQQTQVARVDGRWQRWLERFPDIATLAAADPADVLEEWQGMGYNRRALALRSAARAVVDAGGELPREAASLVALPGIGPATAAGIRAFAWDLPGVYLETNVRTVFLHELFPGEQDVSDRRIVPLVEATCPPGASDTGDTPRSWYYALQSRFEGSHRQKRAELVRLLLTHRGDARGAGGQSAGEAGAQRIHGADGPGGATVQKFTEELSQVELKAGRLPLNVSEVADLLAELSREGFCRCDGDIWHV